MARCTSRLPVRVRFDSLEGAAAALAYPRVYSPTSTVPITLGELRSLYAVRRRTRQLRRLVRQLVKELRDARADHAALAADVAEDAQLALLSQLYDRAFPAGCSAA